MDARTVIANVALDWVKQNPLGAYDQKGNVGDKVRLHYPRIVAGLIARFPLYWTESRETLALDGADSADLNWLYAYKQPAGMVTLIRLEPVEAAMLTRPLPYMQRGKLIYSQENPVAAVFSTGEIEPGAHSTLFGDGVALLLAARLSAALGTGPYKPHELEQWGERKIEEARVVAARNASVRPLEEPSSYERSYSGAHDAWTVRGPNFWR